MYNIIFCDLDSTLLDNNKNIPEINIKYINRAIKKGCKFVISSGRSNISVDYFNNLFEFDKIENYAIAFNGSYIYKTDTKEKIVEHLVSGECALKSIKICRKFNVDIMVYRDELLWFDTPSEKINLYIERNMVNTNIVKNLEIVTEKPVSKVIIIGDNKELKKVENEIFLKNLNEEMTTFFSATNLYEFNPHGIHKGTGLIELCNILNINIKNSIAIGDNYNDLPMIEAAGLGVCCINGEEEVKNKSDYITKCNNNEGAVAEVIKKFIL